jgi:hypothetical protein
MVEFFILCHLDRIGLFELPFVYNVDVGTVAAFFVHSLTRFKLHFFEVVIDPRQTDLSPLLEKWNTFVERNHALFVHDGKEAWSDALDGGGPWLIIQ